MFRGFRRRLYPMENPSQTQMIIWSRMLLFVLNKAERNWKKESGGKKHKYPSSLLHWLSSQWQARQVFSYQQKKKRCFPLFVLK